MYLVEWLDINPRAEPYSHSIVVGSLDTLALLAFHYLDETRSYHIE